MSGVNRVTLVGYLGVDPELKYTQGGQAVCKMSLATSESWKDKDGQKQERTEWHRLEVWGKTAEVCAKYLAKGRQVYIEGRLQTDKYDDKNGITRWSTKVVVNDVQFLGGGEGKGQAVRDIRDSKGHDPGAYVPPPDGPLPPQQSFGPEEDLPF